MVVNIFDKLLSPEDVRAIRIAGSVPDEDDPDRPKYGHGRIGKMFGISGGRAAKILKNETYHDPNYKPVEWSKNARPGVKPGPKPDKADKDEKNRRREDAWNKWRNNYGRLNDEEH